MHPYASEDRYLGMNNHRQTDHERTEALAFLIYLNEEKPIGRSEEHWMRAEESLRRLNEAPVSPLRPDPALDRHERATLRLQGYGDIAGLVLMHRQQPDEGGKFYPAAMHDLNVSLSLPATLHVEDTGETFDLVRLLPGNKGEGCYFLSFVE